MIPVVMQVDAVSVQVLITVVVFGFGMLVSWLVFLTLRHFKYALPTYKRVFGDDETHVDGHIDETESEFDRIYESQERIESRVDNLDGDVRTVSRRQDTVLSNQKKIADGLGVDLDRPRFYRAGRSSDTHDGTDTPPNDD